MCFFYVFLEFFGIQRLKSMAAWLADFQKPQQMRIHRASTAGSDEFWRLQGDQSYGIDGP